MRPSVPCSVIAAIVARHGRRRCRLMPPPRLPGVNDTDRATAQDLGPNSAQGQTTSALHASPSSATHRPASAPRYEVDVAWDVAIPARDGGRLSANIWRPRTEEPVPAILELIPYGKDNWRRAGDMAHGQWFAARGYALVRVDVRGTGSSGGVALD